MACPPESGFDQECMGRQAKQERDRQGEKESGRAQRHALNKGLPGCTNSAAQRIGPLSQPVDLVLMLRKSGEQSEQTHGWMTGDKSRKNSHETGAQF